MERKENCQKTMTFLNKTQFIYDQLSASLMVFVSKYSISCFDNESSKHENKSSIAHYLSSLANRKRKPVALEKVIYIQ